MTLVLSDHLLRALREGDIRFVHWKSNHHLPDAVAGRTDLDLLVDGSQIIPFRSIVQATGGIRILSQSWASYPHVEDWLLHDNAAGVFLHLHVHQQLVTGLKRVKHLILPWADAVLAGRRIDPRTGWPMPSAEMELLVLLIRIWAKMPPLKRLTGPRIPPHILAEERWLEGQADAGLFLAQARALGLTPPSPPPYGGEADIIRMARVLYGQVGQHRRMAWPTALLAGLGQAAKLTVTRLWLKRVGPVRYRKLIAGPGAMVAFTGSDGSGKSTQTQLLLKWLHYKLDAHLLYMGSGDGSTGLANGFRKSLSRLWKKTKGSKPKTPSTSGRPASLAEKIWRLFDLLLLRRKVRLLRKARRMADRGSVMLIDRYPQSQFPGISDGARQQDGRGFAWAAAMERRLLAEAAGLGPDLVLKLHISPEAAHARKPDHDLATIRRKCDVVDSLAFPDARVVVLDAGEPLDQVTLAAKAAVWTHIQKAQGHGH